MCNCGNKRDDYHRQARKQHNDATGNKNSRTEIAFQYTGLTALTITGSVTGRRYRFHHPNDIQTVHYRDAPAMKGVPVLKEVETGSY